MSYEEIEADIREKVLTNYKDVFDYMKKQDEEDHYALYINSMISITILLYMLEKLEIQFLIDICIFFQHFFFKKLLQVLDKIKCFCLEINQIRFSS